MLEEGTTRNSGRWQEAKKLDGPDGKRAVFDAPLWGAAAVSRGLRKEGRNKGAGKGNNIC